MNIDTFFESQSPHSRIKSTIVAKYFDAWAKVIKGSAKRYHKGKMGYIDLFCGPGVYEDGSESTPILILRKAIEDPELREHLVCVFNDKDPEAIENLTSKINDLADVDSLRHKPIINNHEVGSELSAMLSSMDLIPSLIFIDPIGYKGLTLDLINATLKGWGCDVLFFFNYNRINPAITNDAVKEHVDGLFGEERAERLRRRIHKMNTPTERELLIMEYLTEALQELYGKYVLPFRFKNEYGTRTKQHLIFVSKNQIGYKIMKDIMAKESSKDYQGVPSFEYNPADRSFPTLFEFNKPLDKLENELVQVFAGQKMTMKEIYNKHNVGTRFIKRNYKQALNNLEESGRIKADPPQEERRKLNGQPTFADRVMVKFPEEEE